MFGISDYGAFAAAFVLLLFLPGPGNLALIGSASKGGLSGGLASALGFAYGSGVVLVTRFMAERIRANPKVSGGLQKVAGLCLIGFGLKMVLTK
jgi:leucine efflux protein